MVPTLRRQRELLIGQEPPGGRGGLGKPCGEVAGDSMKAGQVADAGGSVNPSSHPEA